LESDGIVEALKNCCKNLVRMRSFLEGNKIVRRLSSCWCTDSWSQEASVPLSSLISIVAVPAHKLKKLLTPLISIAGKTGLKIQKPLIKRDFRVSGVSALKLEKVLAKLFSSISELFPKNSKPPTANHQKFQRTHSNSNSL
jgi:hypothetical protein